MTRSGLFQQRPSQGWGTAEQILDPVYASTRFYEALENVSGWQSMTVAQAAQAVQKSGFPDAYAKWEPLATALQQAIAPLLAKADGATPDPSPSGSGKHRRPSAERSGWLYAGRRRDGLRGDPARDGAGRVHDPGRRSGPKVRTAIRWAMGQLGTPYQWGGSCTDSHGPDPMGRCDCSSLMQQSYRAAGVSLTRTTYTQVKEGKPVAVDDLRPGDLVFTEGTAAAPSTWACSSARAWSSTRRTPAPWSPIDDPRVLEAADPRGPPSRLTGASSPPSPLPPPRRSPPRAWRCTESNWSSL